MNGVRINLLAASMSSSIFKYDSFGDAAPIEMPRPHVAHAAHSYRVRIHGNSFDAEFLAGAHDADGDLAAIGN